MSMIGILFEKESWMIRVFPRTSDRLVKLLGTRVRYQRSVETTIGACGPNSLGGSATAAGRADRRGSSPTSTDGGQPARHRPREESGSARPEQTHRREVPLSQGLCRWRADRHRVRRNWSATRGRPHQAARTPLTHGIEGDDRHRGGTRDSSRIRGRIVR